VNTQVLNGEVRPARKWGAAEARNGRQGHARAIPRSRAPDADNRTRESRCRRSSVSSLDFALTIFDKRRTYPASGFHSAVYPIYQTCLRASPIALDRNGSYTASAFFAKAPDLPPSKT
jgi:hypothetical protein